MSHYLNASEVAEACVLLELEDERELLEAAVNVVALAIAQKLDITCDIKANTQAGFGGLCAGFSASKEGDSVPDAIKHFDPGSDWAEQSK